MNPYEAPQAPPTTDTRGNDRFWALFLAVISLFLCAPLTAPVAIFKAHGLLRRGSDKLAIAALILAAVGLASSLLLWFLVIWQFLTPAAR